MAQRKTNYTVDSNGNLTCKTNFLQSDTSTIRNLLGKGKLVEFHFEENSEGITVYIITNKQNFEYNSENGFAFHELLPYSDDSKAMKILKQIYPEFKEALVFGYDRTGLKPEETDWKCLNHQTSGEGIYKSDYNVFEIDCGFITVVKNLNEFITNVSNISVEFL